MSGEVHYVIRDERLWEKAASAIIMKKAMYTRVDFSKHNTGV